MTRTNLCIVNAGGRTSIEVTEVRSGVRNGRKHLTKVNHPLSQKEIRSLVKALAGYIKA